MSVTARNDPLPLGSHAWSGAYAALGQPIIGGLRPAAHSTWSHWPSTCAMRCPRRTVILHLGQIVLSCRAFITRLASFGSSMSLG
jgi:hypothetical protein